MSGITFDRGLGLFLNPRLGFGSVGLGCGHLWGNDLMIEQGQSIIGSVQSHRSLNKSVSIWKRDKKHVCNTIGEAKLRICDLKCILWVEAQNDLMTFSSFLFPYFTRRHPSSPKKWMMGRNTIAKMSKRNIFCVWSTFVLWYVIQSVSLMSCPYCDMKDFVMREAKNFVCMQSPF